MGFWIYSLAMVLLIPLIMIVLGFIYGKYPPKKISHISGYRTTMSMKNQDTWDFANRYMGKLWFRWGLILSPISAVPMLLVLGSGEDTVGGVCGAVTFLQIIPLLISIAVTERALRRHFDKNGNRKQGSEVF